MILNSSGTHDEKNDDKKIHLPYLQFKWILGIKLNIIEILQSMKINILTSRIPHESHCLKIKTLRWTKKNLKEQKKFSEI